LPMKRAIEIAPVYEAKELAEVLAELPQDSCIFLVDEVFRSRWNLQKALYCKAGESLKQVTTFAELMPKIIELSAGIGKKDLNIVAIGGGSIGDFAGFVASTLKRGVRLIQIPTTWLAAVDSAHGGKTALNCGAYKNQIGSFHQAEKIYLVKDLLAEQPQNLLEDAYAEILKMAFLKEPQILEQVDDIWSILPQAIQAKYNYVLRDPFEDSGLRTELNLGHTYAHVLELEHQLSHGKAVGQGLHFAIAWSAAKGYLKNESAPQLQTILNDNYHPWMGLKIPAQNFLANLLQDKKMQKDKQLRFVFLEDLGKARVENVAAEEMLEFAKEWQCLC